MIIKPTAPVNVAPPAPAPTMLAQIVVQGVAFDVINNTVTVVYAGGQQTTAPIPDALRASVAAQAQAMIEKALGISGTSLIG